MKFSSYHQWLLEEPSLLIKMGLTPFVKNFLGDFSYFSLPEKKIYLKDEVIFSIESLKTVWDFQAPLDLTLVEINLSFFKNPNSIQPLKDYLFVIETKNSLNNLLDKNQYTELIGEQF